MDKSCDSPKSPPLQTDDLEENDKNDDIVKHRSDNESELGINEKDCRKSPHSTSSTTGISQNLYLVSPSKLLESPKVPTTLDESPLHLSNIHPLEHIASITNSLQGKPQPKASFPFPALGGLPMKPYKSILQPLNQTQIDRYEHINTDDVVKQVLKLYQKRIISLDINILLDRVYKNTL